MFKRIQAGLFVAFLLVRATAFADNDSSVMLWFIDNQEIDVRGGDSIHVTDLPGWNADPNQNELAARVHVADGNGTSAFLDLWYYDDVTGSYLKDLGIKEAWINEKGQTGVNYTPIPGSLDATTAQFVVELGLLVWDEDLQELRWKTTLATSDSTAYQDLFASGHISPGELAIPDHTPWTNLHFTVVPEPSSGILLLLGGALCALRRRKTVRSADSRSRA